jgi:transposase
LIANFEVSTGQVIHPTIGDTRTEKDFVEHIEKMIDTDPGGQWIFIVDQLNTHQSASLVEQVAERCNIKEDLGKKGKEGILESMDSRKQFLEDKSHRIRFVYTPKHASWLNQVEIWFSILTRLLLRRGSFSSIEKLQARILSFIDFFNKTMAKPFKWIYTGRPLAA